MQILGACGLKCNECKAFKATQADDKEKLAELAKEWGSTDNPYTVEDMRCTGCMSDVVYKGCTSCDVRGCAIENKVANCSQCNEFTCPKILGLWSSFGLNPDDMFVI